MPITVAFTLTSGAALFIHSFYLRRVFLNWQAQRASEVNGDRHRIATAFLNMEVTRALLNLCLFLAGAGLIFHAREFGYLLAAPPLLSLIASSFALRGIR